ncbi:MAG: membrane protein insertase YidC [Candidatus Omnitrophica bacterium]|nr:membrane protein insertase YidC [Candidatus Omnitrophota bacterium]
MDRRFLAAAIISVVFLSAYAHVMGRFFPSASAPKTLSTPQTKTNEADSVPTLSSREPTPANLQPIEEEEVVTLKTDAVAFQIGKKTGTLQRAKFLTQFADGSSERILVASTYPLMSIRDSVSDFVWSYKESSHAHVVFEAVNSNQERYHISYNLLEDKAILSLSVSKYRKDNDASLLISSSWQKADGLNNRYNQLEATSAFKKGDKLTYKRFSPPTRNDKIVPRGTSTISLAERYLCQSIKFAPEPSEARILRAPEGTIASQAIFNKIGELNVLVYVGPRDYFHMQKAEFGLAFPVGILGKIGLILLIGLTWLAAITKNYGVALILFSLGITALISPFTFMGMRSMKRLQELKPKIDKLTAQHKGDSKKAYQAMMDLYKEHKVSPMGGCLPMLMQFPILIALFQGITHYYGLRSKSFLWIKDLSLPDRLFQLPFSIPILGEYVNLLPLLTAVAMFAQTKLTQSGMRQDASNPSAAMMSGPLMPILFGIMFYQFPSGLVLYWLTNSVASVAIYKFAK